MKITSDLLQAYLKCPMKCWLRAAAEVSTGNTYAEWVKAQDESYLSNQTARLVGESSNGEVAISPEVENLKSAKWQLATNIALRAQVNSCAVETYLHAVVRAPSEGRGKTAQFIPIRFIFRNKLTKDDRLLVAFDAFTLAQSLGCEISVGKVMHGDDHTTLKVKTSALAGEVRKRLDKIAALLVSPTPPDLVLNRHCAECEFRDRCRQKAIETDDLSLLAGMSAKERQKLRSKGIFTVTQLSYTFRPHRRPKRLRDKREKFHHALKALAIREKKIHIVGSPELKIEGTPVYLDVEGLPDRDFYYLIGLRIGHGDSAVQHSLWADTVADEGKIWREFLAILDAVEKPVLIHYGHFESEFLERLTKYFGGLRPCSTTASSVNLIALIFGQIYFPTFSNSLKDIGVFLNQRWASPKLSGLQSIAVRTDWERCPTPMVKQQLINYNVDDCRALQKLTADCLALCAEVGKELIGQTEAFVRSESLKPQHPSFRWGKIEFSIPEFSFVNRAAYWDYQRDKVYVRTNSRLRRKVQRREKHSPIDKIVDSGRPEACPACGNTSLAKSGCRRKLVTDIRFGRRGVSRCITKFRLFSHVCSGCGRKTTANDTDFPKDKYGPGFVAYLIYQMIDLAVPQVGIMRSLNDLFHVPIRNTGQLTKVKAKAADFYRPEWENLLHRLCRGYLLHVDETKAVVEGKRAYVWVFTDMEAVAYVYSDSRDGSLLKSLLSDFKGVLVSDFYAAYDAIDCPQQKCLVHLMRDLNADLLHSPFNGELKSLASDFGALLKPMIQTIDRFGLKTRNLSKHRTGAVAFFDKLNSSQVQSQVAISYRKRFERFRHKLFTFLNYDGVPWNNNNAECAVKAFVRLRNIIGGASTENSLRDYLVLLSLCQTCKYMGVDFLDFLRSGEKDIHAFAESRRRRRKSSPTSVTPVQF